MMPATMTGHVGVGGYGYCTACGRAPSHSRFGERCPELKDVSTTEDELSARMDFGHVIVVRDGGHVGDYDGSLRTPEELYALTTDADGQLLPDSDDELRAALPQGWQLLTGYTGQYGYNGPVLHPSEVIGGGLARDILDTPGVYVAIVVDAMPDTEDGETESVGWAVARYAGAHVWQHGSLTGSLTCERCKLMPLDDDDAATTCPGVQL